MKTFRLLLAGAITAATYAAVACSVEVDLANKECPCGPDYVCDPSRNICVTPAELTADGGKILEDGQVIVPDDGGPVVCPDDKCPCEKDVDCKEAPRNRCLTSTKSCVECLREPTDTCSPGSYCNDQNQCVLGCKQESDCANTSATPHCNTTNHRCVECVTANQCGDAGLLCSPSGACVEGCDLDAGIGCSGTKTCCGGFCLNLANDVLNCGACGSACSTVGGTPTCGNSTCSWSCNFGMRHCAAGNTGCETNIRTDVTKCGSCTTDCNVTIKNANGITCGSGTCTWASCKAGFGNCTNNADGCECMCGSFAGEICCPAPTPACSFVGGKCVGQNPAKCQ